MVPVMSVFEAIILSFYCSISTPPLPTMRWRLSKANYSCGLTKGLTNQLERIRMGKPFALFLTFLPLLSRFSGLSGLED